MSIIPERAARYDAKQLPDIGPNDGFLVNQPAHADLERRFPPKSNGATSGISAYSKLLPFEKDHLAEWGLHLGMPYVCNAPAVAKWAHFRKAYVLDLSTYCWSHTLKDPRSWAIVNYALDNRIRHLVCYTAGNAGASLARLVYAANRHLASKDQMTVFCLVDHLVPDNIRSVLRALGCVVAELPQTERYVLDWPTISDLAAEAAGTEAVEVLRSGAWHVTDGWDGVGAVMYRLMFAQLISRLKIDHVVVPAGTGNLLLGAYLGHRDCGSGYEGVKLWAALPPGENIKENVMKGVIPEAKREEIDHFAPKLVGRYTPLAPCVRHIINNGARFLHVDTGGMRDAGRVALGGRGVPAVAAEPSALVAFAALKPLNDELRKAAASPSHRPFHSDDTVLVVNSGLGLLGPNEAKFLSQASATR